LKKEKKPIRGELRILAISAYVEEGKPPSLALSTNYLDWEFWSQVLAVLRVRWERDLIRQEEARRLKQSKEE